MKKIGLIVIALVILVGVAGGAYFYHTKTVDAALAEQKKAEEQAEHLEQVLADINVKLANSEEEKKSLLSKIDEIMTEDVFYFNSAMVEEQIKSIGELATVEYLYTNVGTMEANKSLPIFKAQVAIPGGKKTAIVTMDGVIKVGIDVEKIKIHCNEDTKTITITLPHAKQLSNELDEESQHVYDESSGIFNHVNLEDSATIRIQIKEKAEENAKKNGVFKQAELNVENLIHHMLTAIPGLEKNYTIEFKYK